MKNTLLIITADHATHINEIEMDAETVNTKKIQMSNARIVTEEFTLLASEVTRLQEKYFIAKDAEFTTCRDCTESWKVFGNDIEIQLDRYITIKHALIKIKGIDVVYIPYIVFPIKNKRESGLLFPELSSTEEDGIIFEQPYFYAISDSEDMTITPTFYSKRGNGLNYQYRKMWKEKSWMSLDSKVINDRIYPLEVNTEGSHYFRTLSDIEGHFGFSDFSFLHTRFVGGKDLDFIHDFTDYSENHIERSDLGLDLVYDHQFANVDLSLEANLKRNMLIDDSEEIDKSYVQSLPRIALKTMPYFLRQSNSKYLHKISTSFEGDFIKFKQLKETEEDDNYLRNIYRFNLYPKIKAFLYRGDVFSLSTEYGVDYQDYKFDDSEQAGFSKTAGILKSEVSFSLEKIFGVAYEMKYDQSEVETEAVKSIVSANEQLIGSLPKVNKNFVLEEIQVRRNSYRHSQEFKFIHHQILHSGEAGNQRFNEQIEIESGWLDDQDAIRIDQETIGANETRKNIPLKNTIELQWNNTLLRKKPKNLLPFEDRRYLKDNFSYTRLGYFNISQGLMLSEPKDSFTEKLTRLLIEGSYYASNFNIKFSDYFFHQSSDHIFSVKGEKKFKPISFLADYRYNSFSNSNLKSLAFGIQYRPFDELGLSFLQERDLDANEDIQSIYQFDFMPNNNCWILNLNLKNSLVEKKVSLNFVFNFGDENFKDFRKNFFDFNRIE